MFNDIRCLIATNNVAIDRIHEAIEYYGLETYRLYSNVIGVLSERAFRERIGRASRTARGGTVDWMEHDGHEHALYEVQCALTVEGDGIVLDFEGSAPQAPGLVNCGPGGLLGNIMSPVVQMLCHDLQINFGLIHPIDIRAPEGTVANATEPAATGYGHLDAGYKISKMVTELLSQACQASDDPWLRGRALGQWNDSWSIETWGGTDQYGKRFAWLNMDGGGFGGGAFSVHDGMDVAGDLTSVGNAIPDIEWTEQLYPALHLWRRLEPNSGGPGTYRGGGGPRPRVDDVAGAGRRVHRHRRDGHVLDPVARPRRRLAGVASRIEQLAARTCTRCSPTAAGRRRRRSTSGETFLSPPKLSPLRLRPATSCATSRAAAPASAIRCCATPRSWRAACATAG